MKYKVVTTLDRNDLIEKGDKIVVEVWPEFMMHDAIANEWFHQLYENFPEFQYWLLDEEEIVGIGNSIPIFWNDKLENLPEEGWDWALKKGFEDLEVGIKPNLLCALSITINPKYQRMGISTEMVKAMVQIGGENKLKTLIIPVRPTLKKDHPLIEIEKYISWKREDGKLFDPWLRVHEKLGGKIIKICSKAMNISGSIQDWQNWTGLDFHESGKYIIPGALKPVEISLERDEGVYVDPNVWVVHQIP
ncbi:MAG: GNAT family N-acetyltransferase [Candidatus Cloacimonadales bacterium]|nr:GNAT family N-acetyltransferase [Candidatus Cloacimonadales bacterium]